MKLVTADQMRAIEQYTIDAGTPADHLMEAAGLAVAQEAWLALGLVAERRALVLVGPGNNGGDGLVAARRLAEWESNVVVYMLAARPETDPMLRRARELDILIITAADDAGFRALDDELQQSELVIDALLGTGRRRRIEGPLAEILSRLERVRSRERHPLVIAVDIPTGVDSDTGGADPLAVAADITVTFGLAKVGLYTLPGAELVGSVQVVDIGLAKDAPAGPLAELLSTPWVRERLPARPIAANKGTFGRVLVAAGSDRYVGAAALAARSCYRAGAGLVTLACAPRLQAMIAPALAEATYILLDADPEEAASAVTDELGRYEVLLIGPGLGQSSEAADFLARVLAGVPESIRGCVIDADALNLLAAGKSGWSSTLPNSAVLTPHPGEMARLLDTNVEDVQRDRLGVAIRAAREWNACVVLKGAYTVTAAPDGSASISPYANPLLAAAGTGDVLAGTIAGFIAQGAESYEAASCGVYVHSFAAEQLKDSFGDRGMLAGDLVDALPSAIRVIREGSSARARSLPGFSLTDVAPQTPLSQLAGLNDP